MNTQGRTDDNVYQLFVTEATLCFSVSKGANEVRPGEKS